MAPYFSKRHTKTHTSNGSAVANDLTVDATIKLKRKKKNQTSAVVLYNVYFLKLIFTFKFYFPWVSMNTISWTTEFRLLSEILPVTLGTVCFTQYIFNILPLTTIQQ